MSPRVREIVDLVSLSHRVAVREILSKTRVPAAAHARFEVWYRVYQLQTPSGHRVYSLPLLGEMFHRDHTTILSGIRRHLVVNSLTDADVLWQERGNLLNAITRHQTLIARASVRVCEIDALLSNPKAAAA